MTLSAVVRCENPTCRRKLELDGFTLAELRQLLADAGWTAIAPDEYECERCSA